MHFIYYVHRVIHRLRWDLFMALVCTLSMVLVPIMVAFLEYFDWWGECLIFNITSDAICALDIAFNFRTGRGIYSYSSTSTPPTIIIIINEFYRYRGSKWSAPQSHLISANYSRALPERVVLHRSGVYLSIRLHSAQAHPGVLYVQSLYYHVLQMFVI